MWWLAIIVLGILAILIYYSYLETVTRVKSTADLPYRQSVRQFRIEWSIPYTIKPPTEGKIKYDLAVQKLEEKEAQDLLDNPPVYTTVGGKVYQVV